MPLENQVNPANDEVELPVWITAEYFRNVLTDDEPEYLKILSFEKVAALPPGENFISIMVRCHFDLEMKDGSIKHKTYVLKAMLDDEKGGKHTKALTPFPKELIMYEKYIPAFEALYNEAGRNIKLTPKCLFVEQKENGRITFIFEDLKAQNFQIIDRLKGFDMPHMRRILKLLARFHAASAVYAEKHGPYPKDFNYSFVNKEPDGYEFIKNGYDHRVDSYKKAMSLWGMEDGVKYIKKFPTFKQYWECSLRSLDVDPNEFNVLLHGDFWSSNIMQNYHLDGTINEMLLIDFQFCKWGNPAVDLIFIIIISAAKEIRIKEFEHFIEIYHEHLIEALKLLKYQRPLPKLRDLQKSTFDESVTFNAFYAVFNHLVVLLLPTDKDANIENLFRDDEFGNRFRMKAMTSPLFVETMKDLFPFFHKRGLFNFDDFDC